MKFTPRKYQLDAVKIVLKKIDLGTKKMLLHLPTGSGKTVIASIIIDELLKKNSDLKILFIAHRCEILNQTLAKINQQSPHIKAAIEQGERKTTGDESVIIASVQSIVRRKSNFNPSEFSVIICDECHRSLASTWIDVLKFFSKSNPTLIGLTATPRRSDGRSAINLFGEIAYSIEQTELQDLGFLSPIKYFSTKANLNLDNLAMTAGDFQVNSLSNKMMLPDIRKLTIDAWKEKAQWKKTIVFCASVKHALALCEDFMEMGVNARALHGHSKDREETLKEFKEGKIKVLLNYNILTEGYDEPSIECVLLARPTTSPLVYNQCLGRGLRTHPGKKNCTIIDIIDRSTHQLQYSATQLNGLPDSWKSSGDPFQDRRYLSKVRVNDPSAFLKVHSAGNLKEVQKVLMELPPESVLAGLDGLPSPKYSLATEPLDALESISEATKILFSLGVQCKDISIKSEQVAVAFDDIEEANQKFSMAKWHIKQATNRHVIFTRSSDEVKKKKHLLRKLLKKGQRIRYFDFDEASNTAEAYVIGMTRDDFDSTKTLFESNTMTKLSLKGAMVLF